MFRKLSILRIDKESLLATCMQIRHFLNRFLILRKVGNTFFPWPIKLRGKGLIFNTSNLQVDGLDAIIVGPYDLSASMGIIGEFGAIGFIEVMDSIINRCKKYNMPCGDHVVQPDQKLLEKRIQQGYRFIAFSIDSVLLINSLSNEKTKV